MEFYNDYPDEFGEFDFDVTSLLNEVANSLDIIDSGMALFNIDSIEETIQLCIGNDFVEDYFDLGNPVEGNVTGFLLESDFFNRLIIEINFNNQHYIHVLDEFSRKTFNSKFVDTINCKINYKSSPFELISKADLYSTYLAYKVFYESR